MATDKPPRLLYRPRRPNVYPRLPPLPAHLTSHLKTGSHLRRPAVHWLKGNAVTQAQYHGTPRYQTTPAPLSTGRVGGGSAAGIPGRDLSVDPGFLGKHKGRATDKMAHGARSRFCAAHVSGLACVGSGLASFCRGCISWHLVRLVYSVNCCTSGGTGCCTSGAAQLGLEDGQAPARHPEHVCTGTCSCLSQEPPLVCVRARGLQRLMETQVLAPITVAGSRDGTSPWGRRAGRPICVACPRTRYHGPGPAEETTAPTGGHPRPVT